MTQEGESTDLLLGSTGLASHLSLACAVAWIVTLWSGTHTQDGGGSIPKTGMGVVSTSPNGGRLSEQISDPVCLLCSSCGFGQRKGSVGGGGGGTNGFARDDDVLISVMLAQFSYEILPGREPHRGLFVGLRYPCSTRMWVRGGHSCIVIPLLRIRPHQLPIHSHHLGELCTWQPI